MGTPNLDPPPSRRDVISRPWHCELLRLLAEGYEVPEIAARCHYSEHAVKSAIQRMKRQVGARNRTHLVVISIALGFLDDDDRRKRELSYKDWEWIRDGGHPPARRAGPRARPYDRMGIQSAHPSVMFGEAEWVRAFDERPEVFAALLGAVRGYRGGARKIRERAA